jgi:LysR family transcriptional regulator, glycine cleavage system transcriptional activator
LHDLSDAKQKVVSVANNASLNLAVLPTFGTRWLVPRLSKFQSRNPRIMIHITTLQQPLDCAIEPFDAAVFHETYNWPGTISHHLMDADMLAVCSPKLKAKRAIAAPADFAKFTLLRERNRPNRWAELLAEAGVTLNGSLSGHSYETFAMIAEAAVAGLGIALLPGYLVEEEIMKKRLEIVGNEFLDVKTSYHLILPQARASFDAVQTFANWLIAEARSWHSGIVRSGVKKVARQ